MSILDRYILKHFVLNFIILFAVLFLFTCIVDLFVHINDFVEVVSAGEVDDVEGGRVERIGRIVWLTLRFYGPWAFQFYTFLVGMLTIGAMGFTLVQMHRNRELTAVLAAGVSLHRIALPLLIAAVGLNVLQFANRELIMPRVAHLLLRSHKDLGRDEMASFRVRMVPDQQGRLFCARRYMDDQERMEEVVILESDEDWIRAGRVTADAAVWNGTGWTLEGGERQRSSVASAVATRSRDPVTHITTELDPEMILLNRYGQYRQMLNLGQISNLINKQGQYNPELADEMERIRFGRFAQLLINLLTVLITLPFFMLREPKNLLVQSVLCSGLCLAAQIGGAVGTAVGLPGVPPAASVFLFPLMVMLPLAVAMINRVET